MKKKISYILACTMLFLALSPNVIAEEAQILYVSPTGNDANSGTVDAPLKTMAGARDKVRALKASGVTVSEVIFGEGEYYTDTVTFGAEDSGTAENPIVYRAEEGAEVTFKGSVLLDGTKAEKVIDNATENADILSRVYDKVKDKLYVIDLAEQGITKDNICDAPSEESILELTGWGDYNTIFVNEKPMTLAQWPNGSQFATWIYGSVYIESERRTGFEYTDENPERWTNAENWWLGAFPTYDFSFYTIPVKSIDTKNKVIYAIDDLAVEFTNPYSKRWKAFNLLEEIDLPGEFYIDRENLKLYIYPESDLKTSKVELAIRNNDLVSIVESENITFKNLNFSQTCGDAISFTNVKNVDFIGCDFTDIAVNALYGKGTSENKPVTGGTYWQAGYFQNDASYDVDIDGCNFDNIGVYAIRISGGNVDTLTDSGNVIKDNFITRANQRYFGHSGAVFITGCGNVFKNNHLSDLPQQAVLISGNNHTIELNELSYTMSLAGDGGAIYQGRNQLYRGSVISKNYIHDIYRIKENSVSSVCAIYMDDAQQGNTMTQNIIVDVPKGYNNNNGAALEFSNNTIVRTKEPWTFVSSTKYEGDTADYSMMGTIDDAVNSIYDKELYFREYPLLKEWAETKINPKKQSVISGNFISGAYMPVTSEQDQRLSTWSTTDGVANDNYKFNLTTLFVDANNHDYRLKSNFILSSLMPNVLNDRNFDMNSIGLLNKRTLNAETSDYKLLYPVNGEGVALDGLELYWSDAYGAEVYNVEIAKDENFQEVIWTKEVMSNIVKTDVSLDAGETYYWRVTAKNKSKDMGATWQCREAGESFSILAE